MDAGDFITLSARAEVTPGGDIPLEEALQGFLATYAGALRDAGCTMIGHIKGMVDGQGSESLFFSLTSLEGKPRFKGEIAQPEPALRLSINVIVAGIDKERANRLLECAVAEHFQVRPQTQKPAG